MRDYLFIDNFRGFTDTCIPITDVNFLVGENSTGKTSVLGLLKLFGNTEFLSPTLQPQSDFADKHVTFGYFSDMVSAHASDRSRFHVGFIAVRRPVKGWPPTAAWLCTFVEDKGLPRLSNLTFYQGSGKVTIQFTSKRIKYTGEKLAEPLAPELISTNFSGAWKQEHITPKLKYNTLEERLGFRGRMPIFFVVSQVRGAVDAALENNRTDKKAARFHPPDLWTSSALVWLAPIRTEPSRTYDSLTREFSPEGTHTPYLIQTTLKSKNARKFRDFIQRVGNNSGLFEDVDIKPFGRDPTSPFEVDILLDNKAFNLRSVGYGVSQALPVLVELLDRPHGAWFAIQQPEVHLHPRAQAALGDVFFQMATTEHKRLLVETHSDFIIDRFRMNYRKTKGEKPESQILFFERREKHNTATALPISDTGELPEEQPSSYRDFFILEELRLLGDDTI
jgi:hypothetical protein